MICEVLKARNGCVKSGQAVKPVKREQIAQLRIRNITKSQPMLATVKRLATTKTAIVPRRGKSFLSVLSYKLYSFFFPLFLKNVHSLIYRLERKKKRFVD